MRKQHDLEALLNANPRARAQELVIREALALVRELRDEGIHKRDYSLAPAFGEKHQLRVRGVTAGRLPIRLDSE